MNKESLEQLKYPLNRIQLFSVVEKFMGDNHFELFRKSLSNDYTLDKSLHWRSELKKSPFPDDEQSTGLELRCHYNDQLTEGGYGWVYIHSLYLHLAYENKKNFIELQKLHPEIKWRDRATKDSYPQNGEQNCWRIDFYRDREKQMFTVAEKEELDAMVLFMGNIRTDDPKKRIPLTKESVIESLNFAIKSWNKILLAHPECVDR